jgi:hypothetical protein
MQNIFSVIEAERFVWATIIQLLSFVRIDVIHHKIDVFLCQLIKACPLWENPSYQLIIYLNGSLLVWPSCITVEYSCFQSG